MDLTYYCSVASSTTGAKVSQHRWIRTEMWLCRNPVECKGWNGRLRYLEQIWVPLLSQYGYDDNLAPLPNIWITFCSHKASLQIVPHLIVTKILLRRLRLVEVQWLHKIMSLQKWHGIGKPELAFSLFCTFLFAGVVLVMESNHCDRIVSRLAWTGLYKLFPKVTPDCFCPQDIPLGKWRVIA